MRNLRIKTWTIDTCAEFPRARRQEANSNRQGKRVWKCIAYVGWMQSIPRLRYRYTANGRANPLGSCSRLATKNGSRATFYAHAIKSQNAPQTREAASSWGWQAGRLVGSREAGKLSMSHCSQAAANADGRTCCLTFISISNGQRSWQRRTPHHSAQTNRCCQPPRPGGVSSLWTLDANWIDPRRQRHRDGGRGKVKCVQVHSGKLGDWLGT